MKKIMAVVMWIIIMVLMAVAPVRAEESSISAWTKTDVVLEVVTQVLLEVDRRQTVTIAKNPKWEYADGSGWVARGGYHENNIGLGGSPSVDKVNAYFALNAIGHVLVADKLPSIMKWAGASEEVARYSRTAWQALYIGVQTGAVTHNYNVGIKMAF